MKHCNEDYFKVIDTEDKAYWLGFLYADGCVSSDYKCARIILSPVDFDHLLKFNKCIESDYGVKLYSDGRYASLSICKTKFAKNLANQGCVPRKSLILKFPSTEIVPSHLVRHFIRGYFDGDGCISTRLRNMKGKPNPIMDCEVNFLGTLDFLKGIADNIPIEKVNIFEFGNIYKFRIRNKRDIITLLDYLYEDSHLYLERKYEKYLHNIRNYITKRHPLKDKQDTIPVTITAA